MAYWEQANNVAQNRGAGQQGGRRMDMSAGAGVIPVPASGGVVSPLANPAFSQLAQQAQRSIPQSLPSLNDLIQGGMASPLLESILGPALQRLVAPQAAQRTQFTEAARAAGGLRGSTYGQGMNTLMQNQAQGQNDLMSQVISQVLGTLVPGQLQEQQNQFLQSNALTKLLGTIRPDVVRGAGAGGGSSSGWENIPPSQGLGTPMSGDKPKTMQEQQYEWDQMQAAGFRNMGPRPGSTMTGGGGGGGAPPPANPPPAAAGPTAQYVDPYAGQGGGNAIAQNPYTGTYETVAPSNMSPYQHTYGEWTDAGGGDPYEESYF
jgi:hypothetical protein